VDEDKIPKVYAHDSLQAETSLQRKIRYRDKPSSLKKAYQERLKERAQGELEDIPLSELDRVKRQLRVAFAILRRYEILVAEGELNSDQERLLNQQQDLIRKLETTYSALKSKADMGKKSDLDVAKDLLKSGLSREQVLALYEGVAEVTGNL
jgi:hypothetical protein